ncbi:phosphoribosylamine--glycine ligase [Deinobacterium chartae]|uniref:Phosphoribosylamine--glycine ligase n=1 Tax=Deinobacterium chartae TaxID=521158 RepID=A0A841HXR1_9DEIO|nr:phosphoribosylamine--glycine ligase [Deinobacterium chartae]MBB6097653.1 phosphoribosylamine--glycine ligase [Deinobacterium chartae]
MRVMVIGSGGREHALVDALLRSASVSSVLAVPGNAGIAASSTPQKPVRCLDYALEPQALVELARQESVDFTVVGPEAPLVAGVVDAFETAGEPIFGPTRAAARLEGSKRWSKSFMARHGIPTARFAAFGDEAEALAYLENHPLPIVVKDSGLAAGKGVTLAASLEEARAAVRAIFTQPQPEVVIEEFMRGMEVTVLAFCDGERAALMPASQDHKTAYDGDVGPMTGGMGVICPFPLEADTLERVQREIVLPTLAGMRAEGHPYRGVLYAGLMLTDEGPKVVEFNARFGDPEAEAVLPLLEGDLLEVLRACAAGRLDPQTVRFAAQASAVVIMAAPGYPGSYPRGIPLELPELPGGVRIFHAGTALEGGKLVSAGGRVLAVQATGETLPAALEAAYAAVDRVGFEGAHWRRDIGGRLPHLRRL